MGQIGIIGAGLDLGSNLRGVSAGPNALRLAGLVEGLKAIGHDVTDYGDLSVPVPHQQSSGESKAKFLKPISELCLTLAKQTHRLTSEKIKPVTLGGDHAIAIGSISGTAQAARELYEQNLGVIWIDAHSDMNTPDTSPSGNIHGMPLAALLGQGPNSLTELFGPAPKLNPQSVVLMGIRDVDRREAEIVKKSGVTVFTMRDIDAKGMRHCMEQALEIATKNTCGLHLSFDIDACDPRFAPGCGTPVPGGITEREAHLALEMVADSGALLAMDMVEINPFLDHANSTGEFGTRLILSAFGKSILEGSFDV